MSLSCWFNDDKVWFNTNFSLELLWADQFQTWDGCFLDLVWYNFGWLLPILTYVHPTFACIKFSHSEAENHIQIFYFVYSFTANRCFF